MARHGFFHMKIILTATDPVLEDAWKRFCGDFQDVTVHSGSILDLSCDAVVSPTDVFGFMTGGVNFGYVARYGGKVQERLQELIRTRHHGQLLVGAADIVPTDNPRVPFVIAAPITRAPAILRGSVNAYLAARAALLLVKEGCFRTGSLEGSPVASVVSSIAFPGLGTGGARIGATTCARQVRAAIDEVVRGQLTFPRSSTEVMVREEALAAE
jgi:O-acetyl-ADP-ribose deacetylase (regulator of RNase III)